MISNFRISVGIERNLEKSSEATRKGISRSIRVTEPNIPWRDIEDLEMYYVMHTTD